MSGIRVPTYDQPQVQERALPTVRVSTDAPIEAFGGGESAAGLQRAAGQVLDGASKILLEEKQKADDTATQKAYSELVNRKNDLLYNKDKGVMTRKGEAAFSAPDEYLPQFDKHAEDISKNILKNETQRAMFEMMKLRERTEFDGQITKHVFTESERFSEETKKATVAATMNDAILNYQVPGKVEQAIADQRAVILSKSQGKPKELVDLEIAEAAGQTHAGVVARMLANGQDMAAHAYYYGDEKKGIKGKKDEVPGTIAVQLEKQLEDGTLRGESQRVTDSLIAKYGNPAAAIKHVPKDDPKLRDAITARLRDEISLREIAERERDENIMVKFGNEIDKTGSVDSLMGTREWAVLEPSRKASLMAYAKNKREGIEPAPNGERYYFLRTLAASPGTDQQKFRDMNLRDYITEMPKDEMAKLIDIQTSIRKGDGKAEQDLDDFRTKQAIVFNRMRSVGIDPDPKEGDEESQQTAREFYSALAREAKSFRERTGKPATKDELGQLADDLLVEGITERGSLLKFFTGQSGSPFSTKKRRFQVEETENFEVDSVDQIPKSQVSAIKDSLRRQKVEITDDRILQMFRERQARRMTSAN